MSIEIDKIIGIHNLPEDSGEYSPDAYIAIDKGTGNLRIPLRKLPFGRVDALNQSVIAPEYDPTISYVVDTYCTYEGGNYKCITPTSGTAVIPEDFDSDKWVSADTIMGMIGNVEALLAEL